MPSFFRIETVPELQLATIRSKSPSPSISAPFTAQGLLPTEIDELTVKVPLPLFFKIDTVLELQFAVARSISPSPSTSNATIARGSPPTLMREL